MTTIQDVMNKRLEDLNGQIAAYQADLNNILSLLETFQTEQKILSQWIATNPI